MKPYYKDDLVTLYHGDALDLLPRLGRVNRIITDPPYGVRKDEEWDRKDDVEMSRFCMEWATLAHRASPELVAFDSGYSPLRGILEQLWPRVRVMVWNKPPGSQYAGASECGLWFAHEPIFHCYVPAMIAQPKTLTVALMIRTAREAKGLSRGAVDMVLRGKKTGLCFRWEEAACLPTDDQAAKLQDLLGLNGDFLPAIVAARGQASGNAAHGMDVFSHRTCNDGVHSCQKPLGLMADLVNLLTEPGDTVADPFAGSATTLLACRDAGRKAIGIEIEEANCEKAARRLAQQVLDFGTANSVLDRSHPSTVTERLTKNNP